MHHVYFYGFNTSGANGNIVLVAVHRKLVKCKYNNIIIRADKPFKLDCLSVTAHGRVITGYVTAFYATFIVPPVLVDDANIITLFTHAGPLGHSLN